MDVLCERCGEPWDLYGVEHGDMTATERFRFWRGEGCPSCYGKTPDSEEQGCELCWSNGLNRPLIAPDGDCLGPECDCPCHHLRRRMERTRLGRQAQVAMRQVLGDDLDGLTAMMEDFGFT